MGRAGAKRSKQANDESPTTISASKKRRTEKKKIAPQKIDREEKKMDPFLKSFCEKFKHPEDAIQFLVQNARTSVADFIKDHWGTKPLFAESEKVSEDLSKIFSYELLEEIIGMAENGEIELVPERDFAFSKVVDEKTEEAEVAELTKEILKKNYEEKFAVQIHQPERFQDCLWSFMEKLESYLGSLVSCLAVLVPAGTQSQPLRYDDTEKFILQLSGSTNWKLYAPKGAQVNAFSDEVKKEEIGDERLTVTLKAGDVLYIPRGTIFESSGKEDGVYLDFGTFQDLNRANLLNHTISLVIEEQCPVSEDLRLPLPPGYLLRPSLVENDNYADMLTKLAESIRSRKAPVPPADGLIQEFMARRLPPYGVAKFEPELSPQVKKDSLISLRNKEHIVWYTRKSSDDAMDEDADEESADATRDLESRTELVVLSSVNNDKNLHMMIETALTQQEGDAFSIGVEYKPLLEKLEKAEEPIKVGDLTKDIEGGESLNAVILAIALNNIGAICVSK